MNRMMSPWRMLMMGVVCGLLAQRTISAQRVATETPITTIPAEHLDALLARTIAIDVRGVSLRNAIDALAKSARVEVQYRVRDVTASEKRITLHATSISLGAAFTRILDGTGLQLQPLPGDHLAVVAGDNGQTGGEARDGSITGNVIDAKTKRPLKGVHVQLDDAKGGVTTDEHGTFRLSGVAAGMHVLHVRQLTYGKRTQSVTVTDGEQTTVSIMLEQSVNALEEVVVTGTVIPTELKAISNAITVITGKELQERGITHIDQLFRGDVPGVWELNQGSNAQQPGVVRMVSRGANSLGGITRQTTTALKTYVDGIELADPSYLGLIDPRNIDRIEILTGPQASTIYGSNAIMGVMQVFTKHGTNATGRPQLTATLQSGFIQNNYSSAMTPQHDYSAQVSQTSGVVSYNAGASWVHIGPWSPAIRTSTASGFGGARVQGGPITADVSFRHVLSINYATGASSQAKIAYVANGTFDTGFLSNGISVMTPTNYRSSGQSFGITLTYAPTSWWSGTGTLGTDESSAQTISRAPQYSSPFDTSVSLSQSATNKTNLAFNTTVRIPVAAVANLVLTGGGDSYQTLATSMLGYPQATTGSGLNSTTFSLNRTPAHASGMFVQGQLGAWDALFLTYGLRADWNPTYGTDVNPNVVPRYGVTLAHNAGAFTAKLRATYGHSTRPPEAGLAGKLPYCEFDPYTCDVITNYFGSKLLYQLPNPSLVPEQQKGFEGGMDLYWGNRASLLVTRYNQTVDNLIYQVTMYTDSIRSLQPASVYNPYGFDVNHDGYVYWAPQETINLGDIRNQGWELQGTVNVGPFTAKGTYSWTTSRVIDVTPAYREVARVVPGQAFMRFPEHTYAVDFRYGIQRTTIDFNLQGQANTYIFYRGAGGGNNTGSAVGDALMCSRWNRLMIQQCPNIGGPGQLAITPQGLAGYATGDLNVTQQVSSAVEGLLQIQNVGNSYRNEYDGTYASIGRQTKIGARLHF